MQKRFQKLTTFIAQEFTEEFSGFEVINPDAKTFYITMGINRYVLEQHIKGKSDLGLIVVKCFAPFDPRLKAFFESKKAQITSLIFVEMNYSGILESLVRQECELYGEWNNKISHQRKYTLYPFFEEEIE